MGNADMQNAVDWIVVCIPSPHARQRWGLFALPRAKPKLAQRAPSFRPEVPYRVSRRSCGVLPSLQAIATSTRLDRRLPSDKAVMVVRMRSSRAMAANKLPASRKRIFSISCCFGI